MSTSLRIWLVSLLFMGSVVSCIDHQMNPLAPQQLRLKTIESVNIGTTAYSYDQNNRITSYTDPIGQKGLFYYDAQGRYTQYDILSNPQNPNRGSRTRIGYSSDGKSFTATLYSLNEFFELQLEKRNYNLDDTKRITGYTTIGAGANYRAESYQYTGDNITTATITTGRVSTTYLLEYDNNPNPYYGLLGAPTLFGEFQIYSRNNLTKVTIVYPNGDKQVFAEYVYQYNQQGLPMKVSAKDGTELFLFTYEPF